MPKKFFGVWNDQQMRRLEDQRKKRGYNAVQSAVLGEFILDRDMPAPLALKGG